MNGKESVIYQPCFQALENRIASVEAPRSRAAAAYSPFM